MCFAYDQDTESTSRKDFILFMLLCTSKIKNKRKENRQIKVKIQWNTKGGERNVCIKISYTRVLNCEAKVFISLCKKKKKKNDKNSAVLLRRGKYEGNINI